MQIPNLVLNTFRNFLLYFYLKKRKTKSAHMVYEFLYIYSFLDCARLIFSLENN